MGRGRTQRPVPSPGIKPRHQWQQKQPPEARVPPTKPQARGLHPIKKDSSTDVFL